MSIVPPDAPAPPPVRTNTVLLPSPGSAEDRSARAFPSGTAHTYRRFPPAFPFQRRLRRAPPWSGSRPGSHPGAPSSRKPRFGIPPAHRTDRDSSPRR